MKPWNSEAFGAHQREDEIGAEQDGHEEAEEGIEHDAPHSLSRTRA